MVRIHFPKPRYHQLRATLLLLISLSPYLLISCGSKSHKQFDPSVVNFSASCNPLFDNQLYPSLILANTTDVNSAEKNRLAPLIFSLSSPSNNAVLRIVIDSSAFNYVTILQEILPLRNHSYTFFPAIKWKYDRLRQNRQNQPLDLTVTCFINDEEVDIRNLHLSLRSVNECPLSFKGDNIVDTRFLFAGYVNEDHPKIQQILTEILDQGIVSQFTGYQSSNKNAVSDQVFAVWYHTLLRGISYSSISCTSNPSPRANVQHIRFFDEVFNTRQANCIDACVYLASILRKIGIRPVIFVEPCHAYLGYYTDKKKNTIATLETTITSWVNFPQLRKNLDADGRLPQHDLDRISKYLSQKQIDDYTSRRISTDDIFIAVARSLFDKASQYNQESYQANQQHFDDPAAITYQKLDIDLLRQHIQPIN